MLLHSAWVYVGTEEGGCFAFSGFLCIPVVKRLLFTCDRFGGSQWGIGSERFACSCMCVVFSVDLFWCAGSPRLAGYFLCSRLVRHSLFVLSKEGAGPSGKLKNNTMVGRAAANFLVTCMHLHAPILRSVTPAFSGANIAVVPRCLCCSCTSTKARFLGLN